MDFFIAHFMNQAVPSRILAIDKPNITTECAALLPLV